MSPSTDLFKIHKLLDIRGRGTTCRTWIYCLFLILSVSIGLLSITLGQRTFGHDTSNQAQAFELVKEFNGKMDPLLAVGLRMGEYAMKKLGVQKHVLKVVAELNPEPPQSYLLDSLQIITGATFGNRHMEFTPASKPKITFVNPSNGGEKVILTLSKGFDEKLKEWMKDWGDPEIVALYIYTLPTNKDIFEEMP